MEPLTPLTNSRGVCTLVEADEARLDKCIVSSPDRSQTWRGPVGQGELLRSPDRLDAGSLLSDGQSHLRYPVRVGDVS